MVSLWLSSTNALFVCSRNVFLVDHFWWSTSSTCRADLRHHDMVGVTNDFSEKHFILWSLEETMSKYHNFLFLCLFFCMYCWVLLNQWIDRVYSLTRGISPLLITDLFDPVWRVVFFCFNLSVDLNWFGSGIHQTELSGFPLEWRKG